MTKMANTRNIVTSFLIIMFQLITFTIKSEFDRWFEIVSGLLMWLNVFLIVYAILKGMGVI